jgi:hypothetical protein
MSDLGVSAKYVLGLIAGHVIWSFGSRRVVGWATADHLRTDLDAVAVTLDGRPRRTFGWKTPAEALDELLLSLQATDVATTG